MEFTTDSKSLAISDRRSISLWNVVTGERQWFHEDSSLYATKLKLFPNGKVLVALSHKGAFLVDTSTGDSRTRVDWWSYVLETLDRWSAEIVHISFSETGRSVLFSVSDTNGGVEVLTWDLASRNIDLLNSANQNISGSVYFGWTPDGADTINWRGQAICIMSDIRRYDEEKRTAVGNRVVIAQDDGQLRF
ncbi:uncharacterized protein BKA55DRAFT_537150 [Fusarium redolens]|uniref:Uncharacterized protein n=1 Tax=Fusarium redolens TaxID=48865 RepID=A0A9P9KFF2_FUSRE|nr:uncharacterized protein BKA55DRAFT_537150 [Fusarium redolens]KAH7259453.1 hypothetical protein BKA55DRAFT_537150 [Fusarium redolens]